MSDFLIIVPARYSSSRFPGKPLADINGKSMIQHVWEKCVEAASLDKVVIATDDERILKHCKSYEMRVVMTSNNCLTGTDRLYEVALKIMAKHYINVQGDEPLISPEDIRAVIKASKEEPEITVNAMCPIKDESDFNNPNIPKVVTREDGSLLYISRAAIPTNKKLTFSKGMKQVCIYAFPRNVLLSFGSYKNKTQLETIEDIEILRLLELGYDIRMIEVSGSSVAVDTPQDLSKVISIINEKYS